MASIIKKISVKNVCGKPSAEVIGKEGDKDLIGFKEKDLMQVVGVATGTRAGNTQYGDFLGFRGQFQAIDLETQKIFRSSQCFLPDDTTDMIAAQLAQEGTKAVEFAFIIGQRPRPDLQIGYEYTTKPLLEPEENDVLSHVINKVANQLEHKAATNAAEPATAKPYQASGAKQGTEKKAAGAKS